MKQILAALLLLALPVLSSRAQGNATRAQEKQGTPQESPAERLGQVPADQVFPPFETPEVSVFLAKGNRGRAQQGMALWGRYIFSCEDRGHVNIYDFRRASPTPVAGFDLASSGKDNHANNAEFGVEKKKGASFPLLYISIGKVGCDIEWNCYVESVTRKGKEWSSERVQVITLDRCEGWAEAGYTPIFGSPSWLVDREQGFLWAFSAIRRTTPQVTPDPRENLYVATKFRIPKLAEGPEVHLGLKDILAQVTFPSDIGFTQAGCIHDGMIYYCFGVGNRDAKRPAALRVYDTETGRIAARYDLYDLVLQEPEDVFLKGRWLYMNANTPSKGEIVPQIYRISLPKSRKK